MLFNSPEFLLGFLPLTLAAFFLVQDRHAKTAVLLIASIAFYAAWSIPYTPLLLVSIAVNFAFGMWLMRQRSKLLLFVAIALNLAALGFFKYTNFMVAQAVGLLSITLPAPDIILPLGISFFTFTQIAFLVDAYQGKVTDRNPARYALFVSFFPHLIAGPILHHREMTTQFVAFAPGKVTAEDVAVGVTMFVFGFFKKVVLADEFGPAVQQGLENPATAAIAWATALSYTLQLYFDFSGYSDMAIGLARLFGVKMPENFNSPYKARSIIDFWTRWHMTLSRFLREYLYIPLGGNRKGPARAALNAFVTMLLGGIWHGAGWVFVVWGAMHGVYILINRAWDATAGKLGIRLGIMSNAITFAAVVIAWVPFRSGDLETTMLMWRSMAGLNGAGDLVWQNEWKIALGLAIVWLLPNSQQVLARYAPVLVDARHTLKPGRPAWTFDAIHACALGLLFVLALGLTHDVSEFLYFQF